MPYIVVGLARHHYTFVAWRLAFYVPAAMHIIIALLIILLGQVRSLLLCFCHAWNSCWSPCIAK